MTNIGTSSNQCGGGLEAGTYWSKEKLMDQRCPQANRSFHTTEAKVQAPTKPKPSHSSRFGYSETSNIKYRKEKKHRRRWRRGQLNTPCLRSRARFCHPRYQRQHPKIDGSALVTHGMFIARFSLQDKEGRERPFLTSRMQTYGLQRKSLFGGVT